MRELHLRLLQRLLAAFAVFDVDDKPVPFQYGSLLVAQRHGTLKQPAIFTVGGATDAHLSLERLARRQGGIPLAHVLLEVIGVEWGFGFPAPTQRLVKG